MMLINPCVECWGVLWRNGLLCVAVAAGLFSISASLVRPINPITPVFEIVAVRSGLSLLFSFIIASSKGMVARMFGHVENLPLLIFRGIVGAAAMDCFYISVQRLLLAEAISLLFINPAITAVLAWVFLKERLQWLGVVGCVVSLLGMLFVVRPPFLFSPEQSGEWTRRRMIGIIAGVASAVLAGFAYLTIRAIGDKEHSLSVAVWFHTAALVHSVLLMMFGVMGMPVLPSGFEWWCFIGIACCSFLANLLISRGLQLESAALGSAVNYLQVILASLIGLVFFGEPLTMLTILGTILIALGVVALGFHTYGKRPEDLEDAYLDSSSMNNNDITSREEDEIRDDEERVRLIQVEEQAHTAAEIDLAPVQK